MVLQGVRSESDQPHYVSNRRFWQRKCSAESCYRIKIGCAFFVTFFAQAKKVRAITSKESESNRDLELA